MKKILLLLLTCSVLTASAQEKVTPELLWKLGRVSDPQLSPDGLTVLYNVRTYSVSDNKGQSDVYSIPAAGGEGKILLGTPEDESMARWRPDGKKIAFLKADAKGNSQIWEVNPDGSGVAQVSAIDGDISNFGYAPAGNLVWFTMDVKVDKLPNEMYPDLPKTTARLYDDLMYRHWTSWEDGSYSHLFFANYANGTFTSAPKDLMPAERFDAPLAPNGGEEQFSVSPDGNMIAYTCKKLAGKEYATSTNSDIYVYDVKTGTTRNLSQGMNGYDMNPRFSPDGNKLFWLSMATPTYEADKKTILCFNLADGSKKDLTKDFDYSVEDAGWANDGKMIYFISGINATDQIWTLDLNAKTGNGIKQLTHDTADYQSMTWALAGKQPVMVAARMSISSPTELYRINLKSGLATQLTTTNKNALSTVHMGRVEKRMIKATDGKEILTWVIYPPDFNPTKKYPAILYCQGGPQSTVSQFFSYRWNFQLMAANGYIVVAPNRRGLPSFGTEWNRQISGDWGGQCMNDYLSAIDAVSSEPFVDKAKLGAVGASFGGYSVYWLAGHHEKRFKAFIAHCGVFDLRSMYGTTEELWFPDFDMGGPYWQSPVPPSYDKFSPVNFVQKWDTPLLVIHNEKDFRVPLGQGMEAFTAARVQNIPAQFLCFPDEGHWVMKPQNSIFWQRTFFAWLDKYLK